MFLVKRRNAMFDFEKISASKFYVAPTSERVVEFSPTDIDMSNVARILSLAVDAKASSVDAQDGYAQVSGIPLTREITARRLSSRILRRIW